MPCSKRNTWKLERSQPVRSLWLLHKKIRVQSITNRRFDFCDLNFNSRWILEQNMDRWQLFVGTHFSSLWIWYSRSLSAIYIFNVIITNENFHGNIFQLIFSEKEISMKKWNSSRVDSSWMPHVRTLNIDNEMGNSLLRNFTSRRTWRMFHW